MQVRTYLRLDIDLELSVWFQLPNSIAIEAFSREPDPDDAISSQILDVRRQVVTAHGPQPASGPKYADIKVVV